MPTTQVADHPLNAGEESEQSRMHRSDLERQLQWFQEQAKKQQRWDSMESGRKARVEALAKLMGGEKPPKRVTADVEHKRVGRQAKAALREYVKWAKTAAGALDKDQKTALRDLIAAWNEVRVGGNELDELDADGLEPKALPPHATLKKLHERVARKGVGSADIWTRYMHNTKILLAHTDPAGRPAAPAEDAAAAPDDHDDEVYTDDREWLSLDDMNDLMQKRWDDKKEKDAREKEEKKRQEAEAHFKKEAEAARLARIEEEAAPPVLDEDGFVVSRPSRTATPAASQKPAVLDGYSWTDDAALAVLYVELSRPVKSNELTVQIGAHTLVVKHLGEAVIKRTWWRGVQHAHDDTVWFLEDGGDVLRFELVKRDPESRGAEYWASIFEGDPFGHARTTRDDAERFSWAQTEYDVTVTARVPEGTSKFDVSVTLQRDALRVYVKGMGSLVDGVLNRAINLKESTWVLDGSELTVVLAKLEKKQPWQRLMVGGHEITAEDAYFQMGEALPEAGDVSYDEMDEAAKAYVRAARELEYARAAGDDELAAEIEEELATLSSARATPDPDRPDRERFERLALEDGEDRDPDDTGLSPDELLAEKRAFAEKYGSA